MKCVNCNDWIPDLCDACQTELNIKSIGDLLTCYECGKPFKKINEWTYITDCECIEKGCFDGKKIKVSVG